MSDSRIKQLGGSEAGPARGEFNLRAWQVAMGAWTMMGDMPPALKRDMERYMEAQQQKLITAMPKLQWTSARARASWGDGRPELNF